MRYYLGLDNGGTNTKAALFTKEGKQVAVESIATAAITPAPDFVERDMDQMWDDNCTVIRELIRKNKILRESDFAATEKVFISGEKTDIP